MNNSVECKDIGVDWIGSIPSNWKVSRFKHLFDEKKSTKNPELNSGSISFGQVIYKNDESIPESTKEGYQEVLEGEFLINPLNLNYDLKSLRIALSRINVVVSQGYIVLKLHDHLHPNYYEYLLRKFDVEHMKSLGQGVRQTISFTHLKDENLVVPPIEEQKLISRYLDKKTNQIDSLVEKIQKKIELLKEQRTSLINHYVTKGLDPNVEMKDSGIEWIGEIPKHWSVKTLKRIGNRKSGDGFKIDLQGREDGQVPFYKVSDTNHVGNEIFLTIANNYLNEEEVKDNKLRKFPSNTIIFPKIGEVLKLNKRRITTKECCIDNNMMGFLPFSEDLTKFIYFFMTLVNFEWYCSDGTIPSISETQVGNIPFISPPKEEQNHIVSKIEQDVERLDRLILLEQQRTNKLFEYRQSLISSVVTGKVRVTEDMI